MSTEATELQLYIENDRGLHRQQGLPILKNLATKVASGKYEHDKAVKLYMHFAESGAKKYAKEFGGGANGKGCSPCPFGRKSPSPSPRISSVNAPRGSTRTSSRRSTSRNRRSRPRSPVAALDLAFSVG